MSLQSEDMGKLVAGQSVLRRDDGGLHVFQRAKSPPSRLICTRSMSGSVERFYAPERFTLVGSRGSDGWIEGEWDESPAGLFKGEYRYFDHSVERGLSDEVCWSSVIAFRPAHREAQPETDGCGEITVDRLAQEIRRVDGSHSLGAGALAEALMPFLQALQPTPEGQTEGAVDAVQIKNDLAVIGKAINLWTPAPQPLRELGSVAGYVLNSLAALASKGV